MLRDGALLLWQGTDPAPAEVSEPVAAACPAVAMMLCAGLHISGIDTAFTGCIPGLTSISRVQAYEQMPATYSALFEAPADPPPSSGVQIKSAASFKVLGETPLQGAQCEVIADSQAQHIRILHLMFRHPHPSGHPLQFPSCSQELLSCFVGVACCHLQTTTLHLFGD